MVAELFKPVIATEIEFYLHGADDKFVPECVVDIISDVCNTAGIALYSAEREKGRNQYEIALLPSYDGLLVASNTELFKVLIADKFLPYGVTADFSAKPLPGEPGNGLHVHIHLEDDYGRNIFFRESGGFSTHLLYAIGGLLDTMNQYMTVFAPREESYLRFAGKSNAPTKISWGTNNRTVAIRLPNTAMDNKRIEHRVAGSDADVAKVIGAIMVGINYGIANKCDPGEAIYGDASLPQYNLPLLARTFEEARKFQLLPIICHELSNQR